MNTPAPLLALMRDIARELGAIAHALNSHHGPRLMWHIGPVTHVGPDPRPTHHHHRHRKVPATMSFTLTDSQKVSLAVSGVDDAGNPTALTGTPVYSVTDSTVLTLVDNGDGTAVVSSTGKLGTSTVTVTDAETDGQSFIGSLAIDVIGGALSAITVVPGTPEHV